MTWIKSVLIHGIQTQPISVYVDRSAVPDGTGSSSFDIVGLPLGQVREASVRIRAAIVGTYPELGARLSREHIVVSVGKPGSKDVAAIKSYSGLYDLPAAVGVLMLLGYVSPKAVEDSLIVGELSLDGKTRPIRGAVLLGQHMRKLWPHSHKLLDLIVPSGNVSEAQYGISGYGDYVLASGKGPMAIGVQSLGHCRDYLASLLPGSDMTCGKLEPSPVAEPCFSDIVGNDAAVAAVVDAVAAGHKGILLVGAPGSGAGMIARRIGGILPPMTDEEMQETMAIHSVAGLVQDKQILGAGTRPFRAPHHTCSSAGLSGGGAGVPRPGEVSLAHNGVLVLDDLPEFQRATLEVLQHCVREGKAKFARKGEEYTFPAAPALVVGVMSDCPCGYYGSGVRECQCSADARLRYWKRIEKLMPMFQTVVYLKPVTTHQLMSAAKNKVMGPTSKVLQEKVIAAREQARAKGETR